MSGTGDGATALPSNQVFSELWIKKGRSPRCSHGTVRAETRRAVPQCHGPVGHHDDRQARRPTRALDLAGSADLVCVSLRTNLAQDQTASIFGVSQVSASRRSNLLRDVLAVALAALVPSVREVVGHGGSVLVDGFLAPTWDWRNACGLYSDKHQESGFNIQAAASLAGNIAAVGEPVPGARHDAHAMHACGLAKKIAGHT